MSDRVPKPHPGDERPRPGESFLQRFQRRKAEARVKDAAPAVIEPGPSGREPAAEEPPEAPPVALTDADMPPLETLGADSDYTGFLSPQVSEPLRRAALRRLFHTAEFNVLDELDDYAEDFTGFTALGDIVTADMRHLLANEANKQAESLQQALLEDEAEAEQDATRIGRDQTGSGAAEGRLAHSDDRDDDTEDPPTAETRQSDA